MEMTYNLPRVARSLGTGPFAVNDSSEFYGTGASVPVDVIGLRCNASRSASLEQPQLWITVEQDPAKEIDLDHSLGASFINWWGGTLSLATYSPYVVQIASTVIAAQEANRRFLSAKEQVDEAMLYFSLNTSQAAMVFAVSRPTIYGWREGQPLRDRAHRERMELISGMVQFWKKLSATPVGEAQGWVDATTGRTLLSLLVAQNLATTGVQRHLEALHRHIQEFWSSSNALIASNTNDGFAPVPKRWRKEMRRNTSGRKIRKGKSNGF